MQFVCTRVFCFFEVFQGIFIFFVSPRTDVLPPLTPVPAAGSGAGHYPPQLRLRQQPQNHPALGGASARAGGLQHPPQEVHLGTLQVKRSHFPTTPASCRPDLILAVDGMAKPFCLLSSWRSLFSAGNPWNTLHSQVLGTAGLQRVAFTIRVYLPRWCVCCSRKCRRVASSAGGKERKDPAHDARGGKSPGWMFSVKRFCSVRAGLGKQKCPESVCWPLL